MSEEQEEIAPEAVAGEAGADAVSAPEDDAAAADDAAMADDAAAAPETPEGEQLPWWKLKPKVPKTEEDYAAIAVLDRLRAGEGEAAPENIPLACIVKVLDYEEVPKANEAYAMVSVYGPDDKVWRLCVNRNTVAPGDEVLFVSGDAALPIEDRWRDSLVCNVKEKVYKFGFGIKVRRLVPHVKRNIYIHNCGVLYPLDDFARDLRKMRIGEDCSSVLNIESHNELKLRQNAKKPKPLPEERDALPAPAVVKARKQNARKASFKFLDTVRWFRVDASEGRKKKA